MELLWNLLGLTIDGNDVKDITINGDQVQEVTIDENVVWTNTKIIDDFEDGDLSEYSQSGSPSNEVNNKNPRSGSYHGQSNTDSNGKSTSISTSGLPNYPSQGDTFIYYVYPTDSDDVVIASWGNQSENDSGTDGVADNGYGAEFRLPDNNVRMRKDSNTVDTFSVNHDGPDRWYYIKVVWKTDGTQEISVHRDSDDSKLGGGSFTDSDYTGGGIGFAQDNKNSSSEAYWDDFYIK